MPRTSPTSEHVAALYLLQSPLLVGGTAPYIGEEIDWLGILIDLYPKLSSGEQILVDAAYDLWGGDGRPSLRRIATTLDQPNFHLLIEAMFFRRDEFIDLDDPWHTEAPSARVGVHAVAPQGRRQVSSRQKS